MWKMCLHGSFLQRWSMSSLQMIHTVLAALSSSSVASGYLTEEGEEGGGEGERGRRGGRGRGGERKERRERVN